MEKKIRIALLQHSCSEDISANRKKIVKMIREAGENGADIICTQELASSQYFCQTVDEDNFRLAEMIPCSNTEEISALAAELGSVII